MCHFREGGVGPRFQVSTGGVDVYMVMCGFGHL